MSNKQSLMKGGYSVEVSGSGGREVIWEVVDNHVVKYPKGNNEIGLRVFYFYLFDGY